jgi:hypothetical protein
MKLRLNELKSMITDALRESFDAHTARSEGLAIFKATFGQKSLGTHKFSFSNEMTVDAQYQLWIRTNPIEFITTSKIKAGNYSGTSQSDEEVMMRKLLDRLKKKLTSGWTAVVRQKSDNGWFIVLLKEIT